MCLLIRHPQRHVRGERCVGIFAIRDIKEGEEVTFDYRFERMGATKQRCHCGEANCRGYLGAKAPLKPKPLPKTNINTKNTNLKPKTKTSTAAKKKVETKRKKPAPKPKKKPAKEKPPVKQRRKPGPKPKKSSLSIAENTIDLKPDDPHPVFDDSEFSLQSHLPYVYDFDFDKISDKKVILQKKLFLLRNVRKTHKYWSNVIQG